MSIFFKGSIGLLAFSSSLDLFFSADISELPENLYFLFLGSSGNSINWNFQGMKKLHRQLRCKEILWYS